MEKQYTEDDMRNVCVDYAKTNKLHATAHK